MQTHCAERVIVSIMFLFVLSIWDSDLLPKPYAIEGHKIGLGQTARYCRRSLRVWEVTVGTLPLVIATLDLALLLVSICFGRNST